MRQPSLISISIHIHSPNIIDIADQECLFTDKVAQGTGSVEATR